MKFTQEQINEITDIINDCTDLESNIIDWDMVAGLLQDMEIPSERPTNTADSDSSEKEPLHIDIVSNSLVAFMKWYKKNVPIGTQKTSEEIVNNYLSNL